MIRLFISTICVVVMMAFFCPKAPKSKVQKNSDFLDTLHQIVTDSFTHRFGDVEGKNLRLVKRFKYLGNEKVLITRTWTGDPHYICQYPKEVLEKNKIYAIEVCFHFEGKKGVFNKKMGFFLGNEVRIDFEFSGNILQ